jgi:hypothetical protein
MSTRETERGKGVGTDHPPEEETISRFERTVRNLLRTPPKPHG